MWNQVGADIDGKAWRDRFGYSVSISSTARAWQSVLSKRRNGGSTPDNRGHGAYAESGGTWTQVGTDIDGEAAGDESALGIDIRGRHTRGDWRLLNDGNGAQRSRSAAARGERGSDPGGRGHRPSCGGLLRLSIDVLDGTRVAIGARFAGHARLYAESRTWTALLQHQRRGQETLRYGIDILDGTRVAIGAINNDGTATNAGRARAESGGT